MNAKYVVALILALQVSMSLCDVPAPDQELVDKYDALKTKFYQRLLNIYGKVQAFAAPLAESDNAKTVKTFVDSLQDKPELQAVVKVATNLGQEASPLLDKARTSALGMYGYYVRPVVGEALSDAIDQIKVYLDKYMPAE